MGVQAGFYFFDGRPVEEAGRELVAGLQALSPDGVTAVSDSGVLLAHGACQTWVGERGSQNPRRSSSGLVMTWDGRLDNRDDLRLQLGYSLANDASDAAIALAIFERHGVVGLKSLVGDWSLVVWDSRRRTLHLARDYMGVRPLYYCRDRRSLIWSSSLGELAVRAGRVDGLSEEFVARFMTMRFSTDVTPYEGIRAVPNATCLSISTDGAETGEETRQAFWRLEPGVIRYRDGRMYEEHLRALWREAVGSRLRSEGTVWAELSGGLDSSSVVCMADALIKDGAVAAAAIQPVSHVTTQSPDGDERSFIAEIEAQTRVPSVVLEAEKYRDLAAGDRGWASPLVPTGIQAAAVSCVKRSGSRVILSGRLGDMVMGCSPDNSVAVFDDLATGRWFRALSNARAWSRACRKPLVEIGASLLRAGVRRLITTCEDDHLGGGRHASLDLLAPRLRPLVCSGPARLAGGPRVRLSQWPLAMMVRRYSQNAQLDPWSDVSDVSYAYPFAHRPLIEFMLAIPGEELSAPGAPRSLMRRAFQGLVPERVLRRVSKGHYAPAVMRTIRPRLAALASIYELEVVRRGWMDEAALDASVRSVAGGGSLRHTELQRLLCLEDWLIARNRRAPAGNPRRKEVTTHEVRIA